MVNSIHNSGISSASLNRAQNDLNTTFKRLSTGLRINSAKDDAAGLAITDRMSSQLNGLMQAMRNANDGISLTQTADGALAETSSILQRMRELSLQSANGIYNDQDRASMNQEFTQLKDELDRIAGQTSFNDKKILNGEHTAVYQVGANAGETIEVTIGGATPNHLGVEQSTVASLEGAQSAISAIDEALSSISEIRGELGATQNRFESSINTLQNVSENIAASRSRVADVDYAAEVSNLLRNRILQEAGIAMQTQANQSAESILGLLK